MAASFPTTVKTFTTKSNNVDTIDASHVNDLQDEVNAIEALLGASSTRFTSWTPTISFATPPTSIGYSGQTGSYAQFGSVVYCSASVTVNALTAGAGTGEMRFGLPVVSSATALNAACIGWARGTAGFTTNFPNFLQVVGGQAYAQVFAASPTAAATQLTFANFSSTTAVRYSVWYYV